jgi:predicted DNA-binding antitoxin AbrB/MazE fold protein
MRTVKAVFSEGVLRPLEPLVLPEDSTVTVAVLDADDLAATGIAETAAGGGAFDFLADSREDLYTLQDGEPV